MLKFCGLNLQLLFFSNILEISADENKHATGQEDDIFSQNTTNFDYNKICILETESVPSLYVVKTKCTRFDKIMQRKQSAFVCENRLIF